MSGLRREETAGQFPRRFTVVGYDFKKTRFESLHRDALRISESAFRYEGLQPPIESHFDLAAAREGEYKNAVALFQKDRCVQRQHVHCLFVSTLFIQYRSPHFA